MLGVLPGTMGLLQATEVIKLILGEGDPLIGRLLMYDALAARVTEVKVRRDPDCPICSRDPEAIADEEMGVFPDYEAFCAAPTRVSAARDGDGPDPTRAAPCGRRREGADAPTAPRSARSCARWPSSHPETQSQLFAADGGLNRYVNVYLNDEDVRVLDGLDTAVGEQRHAGDPARDGGRRAI